MVGISELVDFVLHVDKYLGIIISMFGPLTYAILFLIVFCETGLVFTPFLPGDSLLFISGALAGTGALELPLLFSVFVLAAILGDTVNYWAGKYIGAKVFRNENARFLKKEYLEDARKFYEKHGGKAIVYARFVPFIRTFAPFVAGMGRMSYPRFLAYNVGGGILWVTMFLLAGYFFGSVPLVRDNMTLVIYGIIAVTLVPAASKAVPAIIKHVRTSCQKDR
jgi:membrane-associated protein